MRAWAASWGPLCTWREGPCLPHNPSPLSLATAAKEAIIRTPSPSDGFSKPGSSHPAPTAFSLTQATPPNLTLVTCPLPYLHTAARRLRKHTLPCLAPRKHMVCSHSTDRAAPGPARPGFTYSPHPLLSPVLQMPPALRPLCCQPWTYMPTDI